jgi:hypothetical protein
MRLDLATSSPLSASGESVLKDARRRVCWSSVISSAWDLKRVLVYWALIWGPPALPCRFRTWRIREEECAGQVLSLTQVIPEEVAAIPEESDVNTSRGCCLKDTRRRVRWSSVISVLRSQYLYFRTIKASNLCSKTCPSCKLSKLTEAKFASDSHGAHVKFLSGHRDCVARDRRDTRVCACHGVRFRLTGPCWVFSGGGAWDGEISFRVPQNK